MFQTSKLTKSAALGLSALIIALSLTAFALPASAAGDSAINDTELLNKTVSVSDDTESIRVTAENISNATASVEFTEILNGSETVVKTGTLNTSTGTDTVSLSTLDPNATYRVVVMGDGLKENGTVIVEKIVAQQVGGGALGGGLGVSPLVLLGVVAVVGVGAVAYRERDEWRS